MIETKIRERLRYCSNTGNIYWNKIPVTRPHDKTFNTRFADKVAGTVKPSDGYIQINLNGELLVGHRVVWFLYYGVWPDGEIDHINRVRSDNRISNLRDVSHKINTRNQSKRKINTSGHTGLYFCNKTSKWVARIKIDGVSRCLGYFEDKSEAISVRIASEKLNGFHDTHGKDL